MADKLSRREFLKLAAAGSIALALRRPGKVLAEAAEQLNGFKIDVVTWEGSAYYPHPINFSNRIDFPDDGPKTPIHVAPSQQISYLDDKNQGEDQKYLEIKRQDLDVDPVFVEPANKLVQDLNAEQSQLNGLIIEGVSIPVYALLGAGLIKAGVENYKKEVTVAGGLVLSVGSFKALCSALTRPINPQDKSYYEKFAGQIGYYYPLYPQLSSIRSVLIMDDVWKNINPLYRSESVLAFSESHIDGLENFSRWSPQSLKDSLLFDNKFDSTIAATAKKLGSVEAVFHYKLRGQVDGNDYTYDLSDSGFIDSLKRKIEPLLPPKSFPGAVQI